MPAPHIPTPLEQLGDRPFSFYPAIQNIQHNEWQFRRAHPDEIQVMNTKSLQELWIPRGFLSGVSSIEEPVVIVGLLKELEYREGIVVPHVRRVIEMPRAVNDVPRPWLSRRRNPANWRKSSAFASRAAPNRKRAASSSARLRPAFSRASWGW